MKKTTYSLISVQVVQVDNRPVSSVEPVYFFAVGSLFCSPSIRRSSLPYSFAIEAESALSPSRASIAMWPMAFFATVNSPVGVTVNGKPAEVLGAVGYPGAVDGYLQFEPDADARRRGNVMARTRMVVLFDQSAKLDALPIGTGNKTERLLGYFTWHADDTPPVNPLGDLFKTQVWALARYLGVPQALIDKAPSADLEADQTDEGDLGITYARADAILAQLLLGYNDQQLIERGFDARDVGLVRRRVDSTHWKRHLPTTATLTNTAINEFYLRPVDY